MCCGGEDLPSAAQPIIEAGVSWKHSEVIASLRTVQMVHTEHSRRKSVSLAAHEAHAAELKKSGRQDVSPSFLRDQHLASNCSSALLERTGSDLSISSLPSSSSVAEVYIGRSVLTDESDIDSETERSLESSSKAGTSKQGLRQLVACFLANSLRLKKPEKEKKETKPSGRSHGENYTGKRPKKKSSRSEKDKQFRSKTHRPLGLSSTDGSSYADIPSSALNSQPLPSLSLDASRHANFEPVSRPAVLFSSPRPFASTSNHVRNLNTSRSSPFRKSDLCDGHHQLDGHISEEVTNSSQSSAPQRMSSADRADSSDKRPSTNASSENAASPRRRRNKGPAPKPPVSTQSQQSSSPFSTANNTSCPSSVPQSPTNSSIVTSLSASSKNQVVFTKSPAPQPPHLTRSLSEQKQLNMKNLINATQTFRSEVNLQEMGQNDDENNLPDDFLQVRYNEEHIVLVCDGAVSRLVDKRQKASTSGHSKGIYPIEVVNGDDSIYQTPLPIKTLLDVDLPPELPSKTFDPVKMFGCKVNGETKRLEKATNDDCPDSLGMPRSQSMPCSRYTCCLHHWKEYLSALSKANQTLEYSHPDGPPKQVTSGHSSAAVNWAHHQLGPLISEECECEDECASSDLMNALLSPQHSFRYKKSKNSSKKLSPEHVDSTNLDLSLAFSSFEKCEFIRAMSDGSLTNTSTATVVEFINEDSSNGDGQLKGLESRSNASTLKGCVNGPELLNSGNSKCLLDVFCQTNFEDAPERPARRYKNHKYSCRCRHLKARSGHGPNRHCRHRHCAHQHCDCPSAQVGAACFPTDDLRAASRNVWLTSSTSDHSLSSLSSSTSTLSEASTMRTSSTLSNDVSHCKVPHLFTTSSMSPFGEPLVRFPDTDTGFYSASDTFAELLSGRSPISTERLFKSAENNFPPPPLAEPEDNSEITAFEQVHLKSSTTPLANLFQELGTDMFLSTPSLALFIAIRLLIVSFCLRRHFTRHTLQVEP